MNLKRRQEVFLDGIDFSLDMAKTCYSRLALSVQRFSHLMNQEKELPGELKKIIFLDAWSLVDIVNRLRILVSQTPGLKKNSFVISFQKATKDIEIFRDFIQHVDGEIRNEKNSGWPIWGALSWIYITTEKKIFVSGTTGGSFTNFESPIINPAGKNIQPPVDHILLSISDIAIDLSETFDAIMNFAKRFQSGLVQAKDIQLINNIDESELLQIELLE